MITRQDNERSLQTKIEQLQREIDQMKYSGASMATTQSMRAPTPIERYVVNPRSRVIKQ